MGDRFLQLLVPVVVVLSVLAMRPVNAQTKPPVPTAGMQESATKAAAEIYGGRFQRAKTTADKAALATDMIAAAMKLEDGSPDQYVVLKIAADIAAGAGDASTALQAVEKLVERFAVPGAKLTAETLLAAAGKATLTSQHKAIGEAALKIADAVADAEEYELMLSVCESTRSSAQKTRQHALAKELTAKIEDLQKRQRAFHEYQAARAVMEKEPAEPAANLAAGRYQCFVKGDWNRGVPLLALGSDAALKDVAVKELRGAKSAEEQAAIGDAWWAVAETTQGSERNTLRLRAGFWYRQAEPKLAGGLAGLKIRTRLAELEKLGREAPVAPPAAAAAPSAPAPAIAQFDERIARQYQTLWAKYLRLPVVQVNSIGMRLVLIPPGEFDMGSSPSEIEQLVGQTKALGMAHGEIQSLLSEGPQHRVKITRPFYLGMCEVTQAEYRQVTGTNPSGFANSGATAPVENVSWNDAQDFCRRLSEARTEKDAGRVYQLPTEAQWEYACRAGTTTRYHFGNHESNAAGYAWFPRNSGRTTHAVGQRMPNAWGLHDMLGNVWEWCADWYDAEYYKHSPASDPTGPPDGKARSFRGGSWLRLPDYASCAYRNYRAPEYRRDATGFRVAVTLAP